MAFQLGIGGSERQLTEIAKALDRERFEPYVGCFHEKGFEPMNCAPPVCQSYNLACARLRRRGLW